MRRPLFLAIATSLAGTTAAAQQSVADTVHNLSVSGPGPVRALDEDEVCRFCHVPHNPVAPDQLWAHTLSSVARYETPVRRRGTGIEAVTPQPDGASRLCLSCHDGTVALGDVAGTTIAMSGATRLEPGRRGHIGTDLSGSHPVSFVVPDVDPGESLAERDMVLRPLTRIRSAEGVRLDAENKMQCTTCHDPHSDANYVPGRVPHFWVRASVDEVCLTCHELR